MIKTKTETDKYVVKFGKIIFEQSELATHLAVGLSHSTIPFKDLPIEISFNHVFVGFKLIGAEFDKFSFKNTKSASDGIEVTSMWSDVLTKEISYSNELNIDIPKMTTGIKIGVSEKTVSKQENGETHKRMLPDLRITINKHSRTCPEWKIYQVNNSALVLDSKESIRMAVLDNINEGKGVVELSGSIWTDRKGYNLDDSALTGLERINPIFRVQLALFKLMVEKRVKMSKLLHLAQVN